MTPSDIKGLNDIRAVRKAQGVKHIKVEQDDGKLNDIRGNVCNVKFRLETSGRHLKVATDYDRGRDAV